MFRFSPSTYIIRIFISLLFVFVVKSSFCQDTLTLKHVLSVGLEKNYSILIANNDQEILENNLSYAKYAFFPVAIATGRKSNSVVDSKQLFASGSSQEREGAKSNSLTGSLNLDWTIFDGFGMFVAYNRVKELSELGQLNTRMMVENLTAQIATEYFNLMRQIQIMESMKYGIRLSAERLFLANEKYKIGSFSRLEFLQAQGDYNADSSAFLRQEEAVTTSKLQLSRILAYDFNFPDNWHDSINIEKSLQLDQLLQNTLAKNTALMIMDKNQILSDLDIRSIRSRYYPSLSLNTGYTYTNSESQAGFLLSNRTTGFTYGASLNLTLFNRLENRRLMQNARIEQENRELEINDLKLTLTSNLNQVWNNYNNNLRILALESQNLESARENLDIARARYRLGDLAGIEMREIQQNFLNASNRFINAQYLAKVAEITLKQISGSIEEYF
jgi:outer membrane protein TolC